MAEREGFGHASATPELRQTSIACRADSLADCHWQSSPSNLGFEP